MLTITITISDLDELALRNDMWMPEWKRISPAAQETMLLAGIDETAWNAMDESERAIRHWVHWAVRYKAMQRAEFMAQREWMPKLLADPTVESIPADQDALIALIVSRPDYKDRAAREAEAKAAEDARRAALTITKEAQ